MDNNKNKDYLSEEEQLEDTLLDESIVEDNTYESMFDKNQLTQLHNRRHGKQVHYKSYVKKKDQYMDIYSSGITFLVVGIMGVLLLILNLLKIITIFNGSISLIIMSILFLAFLVIGFSSLRKAKLVKSQIGEEEKVTSALNDWLRTHIGKEDLYENTDDISDLNERYLSMLEYMKDRLNHQFGELEDSYLDYIVEHFYDENFS